MTTTRPRARRRWRLAAVVASAALLAAACGGSSKKSNAQKTTDTSAAETTTTLTGDTTTTVAGETTTTAAGGTTGGTTATTAKKSSTTSKSSSALTKATAPPAAVGGIAQVTTTASTAPAEPPQPGGTMTVLLSAEGNGFDPSFSTGSIGGTDPLRLFAVYDGLLYADGASGSIVPQTAATMTTSDAVTWKLTLKPNIKFTDNTAYDAAAVKYNWDRCRDDASLACSQAATIKTWKYDLVAGDPLSMTITLPTPNGQFPRIISIGGGGLSAIASPAWLKSAGSRDAVLNQKPVGAGPFTLESWTKDSQMVLARNPAYWNSPKPYLDKLIFKPVTDDQQRVNSFKAGEADALFLSNAPLVADLQKSYPVSSVASINSTIYLLNLKHAPFDDVNIRRAIDMVLDRDQINKLVYGGVLETVKGYFPSNFAYSDPSLQFHAYDLNTAQGLVNDWIKNKNNGSDLVFNWETSNSAISQQLAQTVKAQVEKLQHVTVNLKIVSVIQNTNDIRASNFDAIGTVFTGVDPEPQVFQTVQTNGARGAFFTGYTNAAVDKAITDSRAATDATTRNNALKAMQQQLIPDVPLLVLARSPYFYPYAPKVKDLSFFDEGGLLSDRVWLKTHG